MIATMMEDLALIYRMMEDLIYCRWIFGAYFMFVEAKVKNTYSHDVVF